MTREITREQLTTIARRAVYFHGGQSAVARALNVSQPAVHQAINSDPGSPAMDKLLIRIAALEGVAVKKGRAVQYFDVGD